ncbi:MAG: hypothetical protein IJ459_00470 [Clostridia bacterium]|nr:hypothetical protein [Clostridia bacterium]
MKMMHRTSGRKRHPYATLAVFTLAGASMINVVNRMKRFFKEKSAMVTEFIEEKMSRK